MWRSLDLDSALDPATMPPSTLPSLVRWLAGERWMERAECRRRAVMRDRDGHAIYERAECWHADEHEVWVEKRHWRWVDSRWFGEGGSHEPSETGRREAIAICRACPVRSECLAYTLEQEAAGVEQVGIAGGLTRSERRALLALVREAG